MTENFSLKALVRLLNEMPTLIFIFRLGTQDFVIGLSMKDKLNFNKLVGKDKLNW